jgi:hypothetical protein
LALADVFREAGVSKNLKAGGQKWKASQPNFNKRPG